MASNTEKLLNEADKFISSLHLNPPQTEKQEPGIPAANLKQTYAIFINEMVIHGNRRVAYQKAHPGVTDRSAHTGAGRLLANAEIAAAIRKAQLHAKQEVINSLKEQYQGKLVDIEEKRMVLARIIRREICAEKEITKNGETQTIKLKSGPKELVQAIMADNQMEMEWHKAVELPNTGIRYQE